MFTFACPACGKQFKARDEHAGKKIHCTGCQQVVQIPARELASAMPSPVPPSVAVPAWPQVGPRVDMDADTLGRRGQPKKPAPQVPSSLTDFLAPAAMAGDLGRLGPYRVLEVLSSGGMGVVYRGLDLQLQRTVALKAMLPSLAASPTGRQRFFREARAAAALKHPHIVTIFQVGQEGNVPYLAMEFLEGESLQQRLRREPQLTAAEVRRIGRETALGLAAAHERGLVHRDVKPGNIWLEAPDGVVKILDFGLARAVAQEEKHLTQSGEVIGTPAYMAPEQAAGRTVDYRADLFALGAVLYQLLTGDLPFQGEAVFAILTSLATEDPVPPHERDPKVPKELSAVVMRLLAKKPDDRPSSAREVAELLTSQTTAPTAPKRWSGWLVLVVAGCLLLAGLGAAKLLFFPPAPPGTLVLQLTEPEAQVWLDNQEIKLPGSPLTLRLPVAPGDHTVKVQVGETVVFSQTFTQPAGQEFFLDARWHPQRFSNGLGMEFLLVPRGKAWLGGTIDRPGETEVQFAHDFYLGKYEVTQEEWVRIMGSNPSAHTRTSGRKDAVRAISDADLKRFPVELVSWDGVQLFLLALNQREKKAGWVYRLPTANEWEYACRGGPMSIRLESAFDYYLATPLQDLQLDQANVDEVLKRPCKVGSYQANKLGFHDMHGNVWEWCEDEIPDPEHGRARVFVGGSWFETVENAKAGRRNKHRPSFRYPTIGFRVACVPVEDGTPRP